MEKSKLYTLTGDKGTTSLVGGKRVMKNNVRLEAYGTIDELNSHVGLLVEELDEKTDKEILLIIQNKLFAIGANLATDTEFTSLNEACHIKDEDITVVENRIDYFDNLLPPLTNFVLPGGCKQACIAHICRTVCRRAERRVCDVMENNCIDENILKYINRLSDYFFILARYCNFNTEIEEIFWDKSC